MKINEIKPTVTIDLPPVLEAYCRWVFQTPSDQKNITLTRTNCVGKHIFSKIISSRVPIKKNPERKNPVTFILPTTDNAYLALKSHFVYVDDFATMQIVDFVDANFDFWVKRRFETGYEHGWSQDEIINAILRGLNVRSNTVNYDAIKKNDYRNRRKKDEKRFDKLLQSDY